MPSIKILYKHFDLDTLDASTVAGFFYKFHQDHIIYSSHMHQFYVLNTDTNIWHLDENNEHITKELTVLITAMTEYCDTESIGEFSEEWANQHRTAAHKLDALTIPSIIDALIPICSMCNIEAMLDNENPSLFAFDDGVFDLAKQSFRKPMPCDLIYTTCEWQYGSLTSAQDEAIIKLKSDMHNIIIRLIPDTHERFDMLQLVSRSLVSNSRDKKLHIIQIRFDKEAPTNHHSTAWFILDYLIEQTFGLHYTSLNLKNYVTSNTASLAQLYDSKIVVTHPSTDISCINPLHSKLIQAISSTSVPIKLTPTTVPIRMTPKFNMIVPVMLPNARIKPTSNLMVHKITFNGDDMTQLHQQLEQDIQDVRVGFFHLLLDHYNTATSTASSTTESNIPSAPSVQDIPYVTISMRLVASFIDAKLMRTGVNKHKIGARELRAKFHEFNPNNSIELDPKEFKALMIANGVPHRETSDGSVFYRIKYQVAKQWIGIIFGYVIFDHL